MDTATGQIGSYDDLIKAGAKPENIKQFKPNNLSRRNAQLFRQGKLDKIGRNHKCPCGSGKRFKRCCMVVKDNPHKHLYRKGMKHPKHIEEDRKHE